MWHLLIHHITVPIKLKFHYQIKLRIYTEYKHLFHIKVCLRIFHSVYIVEINDLYGVLIQSQ